jgi:hypothetical protein
VWVDGRRDGSGRGYRLRRTLKRSRPAPDFGTTTLYDHAVSYDIYFVNRSEQQSWEEALEALEDVEDEASLSAEMLDAWDRIVPQTRVIFGDLSVFEGGDSLELTHSSSGLQLSIYGNEISITIPYWHTGDGASSVLALAYKLAAVIENETGLQGYDPQVGTPLSELSPPDAINLMSGVTDDLHHRYGNSSPS